MDHVTEADSKHMHSRASARDSGSVPSTDSAADLTVIDVVRDLSKGDRLAMIRAQATELLTRCPAHSWRSDETGFHPADCDCKPERATRTAAIRRWMEDRLWLPDGAPYDDVLGEVWGYAPATIRADAGNAKILATADLQDPERRRLAQIEGANRTRDWAAEAWALGDRQTAAKLNEQDLKVNGAIVSNPGNQITLQVALGVLVDPKTKAYRPEAQALIDDGGREYLNAGIEAIVEALPALAAMPESDRAAEARRIGWEAARAKLDAQMVTK